MWKISEKRPFFRADMAGLGKYCMGGYGRIGVYRDKVEYDIMKSLEPIANFENVVCHFALPEQTHSSIPLMFASMFILKQVLGVRTLNNKFRSQWG